MEENISVFIEAKPGVQIPFYAARADTGMDICASADILIPAGETRLVPTGLKIAVPKGIEIQVRPRSGLYLHTPLRIANAPGTVDAGYRGEIGILVTNTSRDYYWDENGEIKPIADCWSLHSKGNRQGHYQIHAGERIAQLVFARVLHAEPVAVEDVDWIEGDRGGGFGHSGI